MKQIKPKPLPVPDDPDVTGELTIDDIRLFRSSGPLSEVCVMWETVKHFAKLLDDAHAIEIRSLEGILKKLETAKHMSIDDIERWDEITDINSQIKGSSKVLVNAVLLHLLSSFVEFAVKKIVELVYPGTPLPKGSKCQWEKHLIEPLKAKGIFTGYPEEYKKSVQDHREQVRNAFAHGNWNDLECAVGTVDLHDAFVGTMQFISGMQWKLEEQGLL